ncbi:MAG: tetratricopeptide repeat protein [Elusimicrobia bacterium]|nr:tetratricopeptide repeat protein [Elusimicrobiota bacterium]
MRRLLIITFFLAAGSRFAWVASSAIQEEEPFPRISMHHYLKYMLYQRSDEPEKALTELILAYQTNPMAYELLEEIVEVALDLRQIEIARVYSQIARQIKPRDASSLYLEAQVLQAMGRTKEALRALLEARALKPQDPNILLGLISLYASLDDRRNALQYLDSYLNVSPPNADLLKIKGYYEMESNNPESMHSYRRAFEEDPDDAETVDGMINAYKKFGKLDELWGYLNRALSEDPQNSPLRLKLCAVQEDEESKRSCLMEVLEQEPDNIQAMGLLLDMLEKTEAWDEALAVLHEHPGIARREAVFALKESFYLLHLDNLRAAVGVLEERQKLFPDNHDIAYFLALGYEDLGEYAKAKNTLAELYKKKPDWQEMAYAYALICGELEDYACMESVLNDLYYRMPDDPVFSNALGFTWAEMGKNLDEAHRLVAKAVQADPKNPSYQDSMAWVLFKMGRTKEALEILERTAQDSHEPEIMLHLSQLQSKGGKDREAWLSYFSAKFEMNKSRKKSVRLLSHIAVLEPMLDKKFKPRPAEIFTRQIATAQDGFAGQFRCEFAANNKQALRVKMALSLPKDSGQIKVLYWPPGMMTPLNSEDVAANLPQSREFLAEFESALQEFFARHSWLNKEKHSRLRWKIMNDYSVRAKGPHLRLEFMDFYRELSLNSAQGTKGGLVPRTIKLDGRLIRATCEALDYVKE